MGHDMLVNVNVTDTRSKALTNQGLKSLAGLRQDCVQVKSDYEIAWVRRGTKDYRYALSRLNGTCIPVGVKESDNS